MTASNAHRDEGMRVFIDTRIQEHLRRFGRGLVGGGSTQQDGVGAGSLANPSALVGLTAINGSAPTAMRSDAAPALNQAVTPTWTGLHTFNVGVLSNATIDTSGSTAQLRFYDRTTGSQDWVWYADGGIARLWTSTTSDLVTVTRSTGVFTFAGRVDLASGGRLNPGQQISTPTFASGFLGSGFRIDQGVAYTSQTTAEFDNLVVRGLMRVYELVINKIRVSRGSQLVSPGGGKVASVTSLGGSSYRITWEDNPGLVVNDLLRAQKFTGTGTYQSLATVTAVSVGGNDLVTDATLNSGSAPAAGFEYAVTGNTSDTSRQGLIYLTADDSGAPFMEVVDGLSGHAAWGSAGVRRTRAGKLSGITDPFFGALSGYGIYANRGYFNGVRINGQLVIGPGVGFSVAPSLYCAFDTAPNGTACNTNGHLGQRAQVDGGGPVGIRGKFGGALVAAQAATNIVTNPRFAHGTWNTNWSAGGDCTATLTSDAFIGTTAARCVMSGGGNRYIRTDVTRTSTANNLIAYAWVKSLTGTAQVAVNIYRTDFGAVVAGSTYDVGPDWTLVPVLASAAAMSGFGTTVALIVQNTDAVAKTIVVGFVQAEETFYATPPIDGTMGAGYSWAGTAHASASSRSSNSALTFAPSGNIQPRQGTIMAWIFPSGGNTGSNAGNRVLLHDNSSTYFILRVNASHALEGAWGSNIISGGTVPQYAWSHVAITCDGVTTKLYLNGVEVASGAAGTMPVLSSLHIGAYANSQQWLNGLIDEMAIVARPLSADEITAVYNSNAPLNITRSNYELVLSDYNAGKVVSNAGGIHGTSVAGKPNFTLLNSDQTVNGEALGEGDSMFGDNSSGKANLLWDNSAGELAIRSGASKKFVLNASGNLDLEGVLGLGAAGGIWQGSNGSFGSPHTGLKLYRSSSNGIIELWEGNIKRITLSPGLGITAECGGGFSGPTAVNFTNVTQSRRLGELYGYTTASNNAIVSLRARTDAGSTTAHSYVFSGIEHPDGGQSNSYVWANTRIANNGDGTYLLYVPRALFHAQATTGGGLAQALMQIVTGTSDQAYIFISGAGGDTDIDYVADNHNFFGSKSGFIIDHPLHPLTMELAHGPVESPDLLTFYAGSAILDANGEAVVTMPEWFSPVNKDVRYMLTCVDEFAPVFARRVPANGALQKYSEHEFVIAGGKPGMRVDWHVTGVRDDPEARRNPFRVERKKKPDRTGRLIHWKARGMRKQFRMQTTQPPPGYTEALEADVQR